MRQLDIEKSLWTSWEEGHAGREMVHIKWGTVCSCGVYGAKPRPALVPDLDSPSYPFPAIFFLPAASSSQPGWALLWFPYLPLLFFPGRVQEQVSVPVVFLLHVGLRPAGRGLVIGSVIIYHVSKRNPSAPQSNCQEKKMYKNKK